MNRAKARPMEAYETVCPDCKVVNYDVIPGTRIVCVNCRDLFEVEAV